MHKESVKSGFMLALQQARDLEFEAAAQMRDEIAKLRERLLAV